MQNEQKATLLKLLKVLREENRAPAGEGATYASANDLIRVLHNELRSTLTADMQALNLDGSEGLYGMVSKRLKEWGLQFSDLGIFNKRGRGPDFKWTLEWMGLVPAKK